MIARLLININRRFTLLNGEIYPIQSNELKRYIKRFGSLLTKSGDLFPWWFSVSSWLSKENKIKILKNKKFLEDILWTQFCIFLSIRILDDIFDNQAKSSNLLFIPPLLQLEADIQLAKYFPNDSPFWKKKNDFQQKTLKGIIHTDKLQRKRKVKIKNLLQVYTDVAAIFKIGITAICEKQKDYKKLKLFYRFADELAIISQLFDDFYDILEDLKLGKINSAVRIILNAEPIGSIDDITDSVAHALQYKDGFNNLAIEIRKHTKTARRAAEKIQIEDTLLHIESFENTLKTLEAKQHKKRVAYMFSKIE